MCFTQKLVFIVGNSAIALAAFSFPRTVFNLKYKTVAIKCAFQMFRFDSVTVMELILIRKCFYKGHFCHSSRVEYQVLHLGL